MKSTITLVAEDRQEVGKSVANVRKNGRIPAVLYGRGIASRSLSVPILEFSRVYKNAGENTIVELSFAKGKSVNTLIHNVAREPLSGAFLHIDFYQVRMDEVVEASIPLVFVGESAAVRSLGGVLVKALDEVTVSCLPDALPHELTVDISVLATFDNQIRIADIVLPAGVVVVGDTNTAVALVEPPRSDAEMANLDSKVEADVAKVEGVVKATVTTATSAGKEKKA